MSLARFKGQAGAATLACRAFAQVNVTAIGTVLVQALPALQDVDGLPMVRAREAGSSQILLLISVLETNSGRPLANPCHLTLLKEQQSFST
ncbi:hypothetical protein [Stenotrophomonas sp.]|uniref:hypothetical protein n=1 Tax=Stenotrophomonas sp. TaxID=69392 RepID=UPI0028A8F357|nr:hypothetical protein [Stenotrophomonas sp.]